MKTEDLNKMIIAARSHAEQNEVPIGSKYNVMESDLGFDKDFCDEIEVDYESITEDDKETIIEAANETLKCIFREKKIDIIVDDVKENLSNYEEIQEIFKYNINNYPENDKDDEEILEESARDFLETEDDKKIDELYNSIYR